LKFTSGEVYYADGTEIENYDILAFLELFGSKIPRNNNQIAAGQLLRMLLLTGQSRDRCAHAVSVSLQCPLRSWGGACDDV